MSASALSAEIGPSDDDLDRCARGQHNHEMSERPGLVRCVHCNQVEAAPACQFFVSPQVPTCGKRSVAIVTVTSQAIKAKVFLCTLHKQQHDVTFARKRTKS